MISLTPLELKNLLFGDDAYFGQHRTLATTALYEDSFQPRIVPRSVAERIQESDPQSLMFTIFLHDNYAEVWHTHEWNSSSSKKVYHRRRYDIRDARLGEELDIKQQLFDALAAQGVRFCEGVWGLIVESKLDPAFAEVLKVGHIVEAYTKHRIKYEGK